MGWVHWADLILGSTKSPKESFEKAMELVQKALAMDDSISNAHSLLSPLYLIIREHDKAIAEGERAVALDPGGAVAHESYAWSLLYAGRSEEALSMAQKAIRLNPNGPPVSIFCWAPPIGLQVVLRRRFRPIRRPSCRGLITFFLILV